MAVDDLRDWLQKVEQIGQLKRIEGADWDEEIGCITDLVLREKKIPPALLFTNIKGYSDAYRLLTLHAASTERMALILGLPSTDSISELLQIVLEHLSVWENGLDQFHPQVVNNGPVLENVHSGNDINLFEFPAPKWHWRDGGRYIGTGDVVITRDPDTGEVNLGTYRMMIHDRDTTGFYISPGQHGRIHYEKYHARGEPCPVAISFGHHPLFFRVASVAVPSGTEYQYAGAIAGQPIKIIEEEVTGLPIPADSEIVIAGWSPPNETRTEGPFGEWTGYYASKERPTPIIKVERIYHRNDPIILGFLTGRPPADYGSLGTLMQSAMLHRDLIRMGVPDVKRVWLSEWGFKYFIVVSIKQRYAGHARQAAFAASQGSRIGANHGRYVIVVDDDIDPTDMSQVIWALCTRSDPEKDIDLIRRAWSNPLDPMIRKPAANGLFNSRAIIDACRPYEWIDEFPEVVEPRPDLVESTKAKWRNVLASL